MFVTPKMPCKSIQPVTRVPSAAQCERWAGLSTRDGMRSQANPRCLRLEPKLLSPCFGKSEPPGRVLAPRIGCAVSPPDSTSLCCTRYRRCRMVAEAGNEQRDPRQPWEGMGKLDTGCGVRAWGKEAHI